MKKLLKFGFYAVVALGVIYIVQRYQTIVSAAVFVVSVVAIVWLPDLTMWIARKLEIDHVSFMYDVAKGLRMVALGVMAVIASSLLVVSTIFFIALVCQWLFFWGGLNAIKERRLLTKHMQGHN